MYPKLSTQLIHQAARALSLGTTGAKASPAIQSRLDQIQNTMQHCPQGQVIRTLGDLREECSQLNYWGVHKASASIVTQTDHPQSLYTPQSTPAAAFLIQDPHIKGIADTLFLTQPKDQTPEIIQKIRLSSVQALKSGYLQQRFVPQMMYGCRQTNVNEMLISYNADQVQGYVLTLKGFSQSDHLKIIDPCLQINAKTHYETANYLRQVAQIALASLQLGVKPIVVFNGKTLESIDLDKHHWQGYLQQINRQANNPHWLQALNNPTDTTRNNVTGLISAVAQLDGQDKWIDPNLHQHIGGMGTAIPFAIAQWLTHKA